MGAAVKLDCSLLCNWHLLLILLLLTRYETLRFVPPSMAPGHMHSARHIVLIIKIMMGLASALFLILKKTEKLPQCTNYEFSVFQLTDPVATSMIT